MCTFYSPQIIQEASCYKCETFIFNKEYAPSFAPNLGWYLQRTTYECSKCIPMESFFFFLDRESAYWSWNLKDLNTKSAASGTFTSKKKILKVCLLSLDSTTMQTISQRGYWGVIERKSKFLENFVPPSSKLQNFYGHWRESDRTFGTFGALIKKKQKYDEIGGYVARQLSLSTTSNEVDWLHSKTPREVLHW